MFQFRLNASWKAYAFPAHVTPEQAPLAGVELDEGALEQIVASYSPQLLEERDAAVTRLAAAAADIARLKRLVEEAEAQVEEINQKHQLYVAQNPPRR